MCVVNFLSHTCKLGDNMGEEEEEGEGGGEGGGREEGGRGGEDVVCAINFLSDT